MEEAPAETSPDKAKKDHPADRASVPDDAATGAGIEVPNLIGKDHQLAQDTLQSVGLYLIAEKDCTGQDRLLLWDRNWTVVEQTPPPGTVVSEDTTVTLCSKKDGE